MVLLASGDVFVGDCHVADGLICLANVRLKYGSGADAWYREVDDRSWPTRSPRVVEVRYPSRETP